MFQVTETHGTNTVYDHCIVITVQLVKSERTLKHRLLPHRKFTACRSQTLTVVTERSTREK